MRVVRGGVGCEDPLLRAAKDEVDRSLDDPGLTPTIVADRIGVSTRYLHRLFSDAGPSFGRWLLVRRLERSRGDLGNPHLGHWTVTEVAWHNGFADPSYFARVFKSHYGVTPSGLRAARSVRIGQAA